MHKAIDLPLHSGKCPAWLYPKMVELSKAFVSAYVEEFGTKKLIERLSHPLFFQAFGSFIGFDWHSSGLTTTTTAALKDAIKQLNIGLDAFGGKGKRAIKTIEEIEQSQMIKENYKEKLKNTSRIVAKVDNALIQDGYNIYHHFILIDEKQNWTIIQQGMNEQNHFARRYHWTKTNYFFDHVAEKIAGSKEKEVLDLAGKENKNIRKASIDALKEIEKVKVVKKFHKDHRILKIDLSEKDIAFLKRVAETNPQDYKELMLFKGMGPKKLRALALAAALMYGEEINFKDPAIYAYAHGGKDSIPYPIDFEVYENTIHWLKEKFKGLKTLKEFFFK